MRQLALCICAAVVGLQDGLTSGNWLLGLVAGAVALLLGALGLGKPTGR